MYIIQSFCFTYYTSAFVRLQHEFRDIGVRGLSILLLFQRHDEKGSGRMALQHFVVQYYILLLLSSWSDSCDTCAVWWQFDKINKEPPCALLAEPLISTKGGRSLTILGLQKSVREKKHFFPLLFEVNRTKVFSTIQSNSVFWFCSLKLETERKNC